TNATRLAPLTTGSASKLGTVMLFSALTTRAPGVSAATSWLVDRFPTSAGVKLPALPGKGFVPSIRNLLFHFRRLASAWGTLSQGTARSTTSQAAASSLVAAVAPGPS